MLDGEIGNAAPRIELIGRRERVGRTDVETGAALPAMIALRRVRLECQRREHRSQKQPGAEFAADQICVLALPTHARRLGQRLFQDRRGVDEDLHLRREFGGDETRQPFQFFLEHVVIIGALGIGGNRAESFFRQHRERIAIGGVIRSEHDNAFGLRPQCLRIGAALCVARHPLHRAVTALLKEIFQAR